MGGVLSSIPLCSRAKEIQDVPELDLRPEERPEAMVVTQPEPASQVNVNFNNEDDLLQVSQHDSYIYIFV